MTLLLIILSFKYYKSAHKNFHGAKIEVKRVFKALYFALFPTKIGLSRQNIDLLCCSEDFSVKFDSLRLSAKPL